MPVPPDDLSPTNDELRGVAELAAATIPACAAGSVTLWRDGVPYTAVSTDDLAQRVDDAQYDAGEGPCLAAGRDAVTYVVDDMRAETRWPAFAPVAAERGALSSMSLPVTVNGRCVGALNLYSDAVAGFRDAAEVGTLLARQAGVAFANALLAEQLEEAMRSRAVIEQAKGILIADRGCDADEAFELLRQASQRENAKLRDVAARIVNGRTRRGY